MALPALGVERIPRTLVFWTVWTASAVSLVLILYSPAAAQMLRVDHPPGVHGAVAVLLGVLAVGWRLRLILRSRTCPESDRTKLTSAVFSSP